VVPVRTERVSRYYTRSFRGDFRRGSIQFLQSRADVSPGDAPQDGRAFGTRFREKLHVSVMTEAGSSRVWRLARKVIHPGGDRELANRERAGQWQESTFVAGRCGRHHSRGRCLGFQPKGNQLLGTNQAGGRAGSRDCRRHKSLGVGATTAVGCAALAYRLRKPKNPWQKGSERAQAIVSQSARQLKPWLPVIASAGISAASAAYRSKSRKQGKNPAADRAANAAYRVADAGSKFWRRVQTISREAGKLYPSVRQRIA
jgi:hypothetical protein